MKKLLSIFFLFSISYTQSEIKHCGADEMQHELLLSKPDIISNWQRNYTKSNSFIETFSMIEQKTTAPQFIIPVVVHVIHFDGNENISDAQVKNGIDILNRNYRKLNPDTVDIVPEFVSIAADLEIEFRLATLDPNGRCTNGINRIRSSLTNTGGHNVKELIHWPREKYLNIYIVKNAAGLAGHCLMPFQADTIPQWDGIVIGFDYFGNIGASNDLRSVVLSHEVGHYLNLYHVWGGNNVPSFYYLPVGLPTNCSEDDGVMDTPNTVGWSSCNLAGNSCDTLLDNVQNFMDYAYCARMFTQGQKARMHAALNDTLSDRNNLWTNSNLTTTGVINDQSICYVNFNTPRQVYCVGDSIPFYDLSVVNPSSWEWDFGDGNSSLLQNPKHAYSIPGIYSVKLKSSNINGSDSILKENFIYILNDVPSELPLQETYEWIPTLSDGFMKYFTENENNWTIFNGAGATGLKSLTVNSQDDTLSYKYTIYSPKMDLTGFTDPKITFKYAFARKDSTNTDQLLIKGSKNCGITFGNLLVITNLLPTHTGYVNSNYIPTSADWKLVTITVPSSYRTSEFFFKMDFVSKGGNNIFIDDINIFDLATISIEEETTRYIHVYPNPVSEILTIETDFEIMNSVVNIYNLQGKRVYTNDLQSNKLNISFLPSGMYFIEINKENYKLVQKFSKL